MLYEQGVEKATLANIAAAEVPLGNVYYYFKTKDALVAAVIDSYGDSYDGLSAEFDQHQQEDELRAGAGTILAGLIDWAEAQFREMGRDDARELAVALIAAYEGIALLAATLRDPGLDRHRRRPPGALDRLPGRIRTVNCGFPSDEPCAADQDQSPRS